MKHLLTLLIFIVALSGAALAQDDKAKVYLGFTSLKPESNPHIRGVEGSVVARILKRDNVAVEGTGGVAGHFRGGGNNVQAYGGPQVSFGLANDRVRPFVRLTFGTTYVFQTNNFTTGFGGGVDVNLGKYFVRPFQYDRQWIGGLANVDANRFGFGAGRRF